MKNIQAQYQDLLEGKMSKSNFMRNVRMQFPQHISPVTSFDDSVKILKGKRILSEAKKPEGVYGHNPNAETDEYRRIDHLNYYQVYHGIQFELAKMPEITDEAYIKARKKVVDTILKDPDAYKDLQLANFKAVKKMDKDLEMKAVKKDNHKDKPNEMKVVSKDAKGNTQDTLGKKEARKAKNGKGIQHMTQSPRGGLKAFDTPGKEQVMALKEHILDEMTNINPTHEYIGKGARVKKKDDSKAGEVLEFDGDTATVQWDDGTTEHIQMNVLTKKDVPNPQAKPSENPFAKMSGIQQDQRSSIGEDSPVADSTPKHKIIAQLMGPDFYLAKKPENQWDEKDYDLFSRLSKMAQETGKVPSLRSVTEDYTDQYGVGNLEEEAELETLREKVEKILKELGYVIKTKNGGVVVGSGTDANRGKRDAKGLEQNTKKQLTVTDLDTGIQQEV